MYPILFEIAGFRVDTYSVMWFMALSLAIVWVIHRLELYNIDEDEARKIMSVSFLFMLLGAHAPEYFSHWREYLNSPSLFLNFNRGGLHEAGALLGAFISSLLLSLFSKKVSFLKLCEAAAIPAMLSISIGRWGCFLNGCCLGLPTKFFTGVHFPFDKTGLFRHPVQIYYSITTLIIVVLLLLIEKIIDRKYKLSNSDSIIAPLALISYSFMRLFVDFARASQSLSWRISNVWNYKAIAILLPLECIWLLYGIRKLNKLTATS
ncbi:MAG: prolipoprotein diacylglyceryl transferase [Synergistaceae bacterium]|nr:prolipoprotein diacylglyceryl transferase [Synergistaceae bacterium]